MEILGIIFAFLLVAIVVIAMIAAPFVAFKHFARGLKEGLKEPVPAPPVVRTDLCGWCGGTLESGERFCRTCGSAVQNATAQASTSEVSR